MHWMQPHPYPSFPALASMTASPPYQEVAGLAGGLGRSLAGWTPRPRSTDLAGVASVRYQSLASRHFSLDHKNIGGPRDPDLGVAFLGWTLRYTSVVCAANTGCCGHETVRIRADRTATMDRRAGVFLNAATRGLEDSRQAPGRRENRRAWCQALRLASLASAPMQQGDNTGSMERC
jgi:hypothetical protein